MKKIIFIVIPSIILALIVFIGFQFFINTKNAKGALQITSDPKSKVYLDNKYIGETPLCLCGPLVSEENKIEKEMITIGDYVIKLVPATKEILPYEEKISISKSVLTVVDRKFVNSTSSEGSVISLTPLSDKEKIELQVITFPEGANVLLDAGEAGKGPLLISNDLTESDHALVLKKDGYKEKTLKIRTPKGYRLTAVVYLGIELDSKKEEDELIASPSATLTPIVELKRIKVLQTPNGFLRVRDKDSVTSTEITRVKTNEEFEVVDESTGWYKIKLPTGDEGWISSEFAEELISN